MRPPQLPHLLIPAFVQKVGIEPTNPFGYGGLSSARTTISPLLQLFVPQVGLEPTRYYYFATVSKTVMYYQFQHWGILDPEIDTTRQPPLYQSGALHLSYSGMFIIYLLLLFF